MNARPRNDAEMLLARVQAAIMEPGFPNEFLPARWQGLRNCAGNASARKAWLKAALRVSTLQQPQRDWLTALCQAAETGSNGWSAEALAALGQMAAKRKQATPSPNTLDAT